MNEDIRSREVRLIDAEGKNVGVVPLKEALVAAAKEHLDLVEITGRSSPPVVRIADYGKYQYEQNKLKKKWSEQDRERGKKRVEETKHTQIKPGTSGDTLELRIRKIRDWLDNGSNVQVDLYLFGRYKGMDETFLKEKLNTFVEQIPGDVKRVNDIQKSAKGFSVTLRAS
ncbi:MAG: translation initiation factor IF-3 [Candidatus Kaiserbacteria bacterium]|nr:translation initiation factor IF-3 [Candidatus Kaiserbacteria bacterium]